MKNCDMCAPNCSCGFSCCRQDEVAFNVMQKAVESKQAEIGRLTREIAQLKAAQNLVLDQTY